MAELIPDSILKLIGLGTVIVIAEISAAWIKAIVNKKVHNGNGDRRKNDMDWSSILITGVTNLNQGFGEMKDAFRGLEAALKNGLRHDLQEMHTTVQKCHELNAIKEHDLRRRE